MELKNGEIYRGELHEVEDCWNVQLINVQATARDGKVRRWHLNSRRIVQSRQAWMRVPTLSEASRTVTGTSKEHPVGATPRCARPTPAPAAAARPIPQVTQMEHIYIRGSRIRFVIVPDMLKNAPMVSKRVWGVHGGGSRLDALMARCSSASWSCRPAWVLCCSSLLFTAFWTIILMIRPHLTGIPPRSSSGLTPSST